MNRIRIMAYGLLLGVLQFIHSGVFMAFVNDRQRGACVLSIFLLVLIGFVMRRWVWQTIRQGMAFVGVGFLTFLLIYLYLIIFRGPHGHTLGESLVGMVWGFVIAFIPCLWLPLVLGALLGGLWRVQAGAR